MEQTLNIFPPCAAPLGTRGVKMHLWGPAQKNPQSHQLRNSFALVKQIFHGTQYLVWP